MLDFFMSINWTAVAFTLLGIAVVVIGLLFSIITTFADITLSVFKNLKG
ncbi:hypothetical protein phiAS5_ORF0238 [Aeromonas phage phiAS5]|uniref:Uncharacterized protein n=1 Tax=Aeromonas phage phiAS5 TaxID=879630 RepID=E1A1Z2_9CAUD|nr:hypothetical protein phiAS5_ORF0238 [Aeromonas phage phiAS5]ADM80081.1 hypothetical protein phiAS5_ORF0238 [Aeromonas phage phiAS5]